MFRCIYLTIFFILCIGMFLYINECTLICKRVCVRMNHCKCVCDVYVNMNMVVPFLLMIPWNFNVDYEILKKKKDILVKQTTPKHHTFLIVAQNMLGYSCFKKGYVFNLIATFVLDPSIKHQTSVLFQQCWRSAHQWVLGGCFPLTIWSNSWVEKILAKKKVIHKHISFLFLYKNELQA